MQIVKPIGDRLDNALVPKEIKPQLRTPGLGSIRPSAGLGLAKRGLNLSPVSG
jgi:hypothetical protein